MYLETSRLVLREFRDDDFDALFEMDSRPESVRYEPQKGPDGTRAYLKNAAMAAFFEPCTHYRFAITIRPNNGVRGMIGLAANSDMTRSWEIGWMVHPDEWGKGYASEAARRVLESAFRDLNAHRVIACCDAENFASERVMQKLGMRREARMLQTRLLRGEWRDELLYAVLESEWQDR